MNSKQEALVESLELQIVKLAFFIVSYVAIIEISRAQLGATSTAGSLQLDIDIRSVLVFVITSWIDCLEWSSSQSNFYQGKRSMLQERRLKRNVVGGILGVFLVPICFVLLFAKERAVDITLATQVIMGIALAFIVIKMFAVIELAELKCRKRRKE